jgi:multimeric flavodoxin WrbA
MKVLGISCGRRMGNSEILLKEALMAMEAEGAEIEMIRLHDLYIKPCVGCNGCIMSCINGGEGNCVLKGDDMEFFREKFLDSDALIISAPAYNNTAPGYFRLLGDRAGPAFDREFKRYARDKKGATIDERWFKDRPAGTIIVGGGPQTHVQTALAFMFHFLKSPKCKLVDQFAATFCPAPGQVVTHPEYLERAAQLGRNVMSQYGKSFDEIEWLGGTNYVCDNCHGNAIVIDEINGVHCATCSKPGRLVEVDGKIKVEFFEEELAADDPKYREQHIINIGRRHDEFKEYIAQHPVEFDKYRNYKEFSKPTRA